MTFLEIIANLAISGVCAIIIVGSIDVVKHKIRKYQDQQNQQNQHYE